MPKLRLPQPLLLAAAMFITCFIQVFFAHKPIALGLPPAQNLIEQKITDLPDGMYVVVGSFKIHSNAIRYSQMLDINGKKPEVGTYNVNGMHYVYAYYSEDNISFAREKRTELRATRQFFDAWILYVGINPEELIRQEFQIERKSPDLSDGMYVVVGSFKIHGNAIRYANSLEIKGKKPKVGTYHVNKMHYVYAYYSEDELTYVREKRAELRATVQFFDAWILYVGIKLEDLIRQDNQLESEEIVFAQPAPVEIQEGGNDEAVSEPDSLDKELYRYQFNVVNATNLKEVPGYIKIVDAARNKTMMSVSTNETHTIKAPASVSKEIIVICDVFGFVKEQVLLKIDDPLSSPDRSSIVKEVDLTTVNFALSRHTKIGELLTMYNVYFYTNSTIMKPESQFELNSLLSMLMENEDLEIKIHGHTNGNAAGKIISLKKDDKNYFRSTNNNITGFGSAKELSQKRAETIMRWLMEQGIDKSRMKIKAWGGKKMIYKKNDSMAERNVRVEIELLQI